MGDDKKRHPARNRRSEGQVAQIEGATGSPNARARIKGFKEQLATYPDLQLVASQPGNWDRLTALNATSNILRQSPDLIGIYANNDGMTLGVFEAVKNANAAGKTLVVGTDGIREAKKSVQAGEMSATVGRIPLRRGPTRRRGGASAPRLSASPAVGGFA